MNRFKRELRNRGYRLENDFEYLPYEGIESVKADAECASYSMYHICAGWTRFMFDRAFNESVEMED